MSRRPVSQGSEPTATDNEYGTGEAIANHRRESVHLAVKARWIAAGIIAILLPCINPTWPVLYYEFLLGLFALVGWAYRKWGTTGSTRIELALISCDIALLAVAIIVPNPFHETDWPVAMRFRFENFTYFFVLLAMATLSYSWRTLITMAILTTALWLIGVAAVNVFDIDDPRFTESTQAAFSPDAFLARILDPNNVRIDLRMQEVVLFAIVAAILALSVYRSQQLLLKHAASERERANLARYFSPNVVNELSHNDEPLRKVRSQDVAVLFVDLVDFTAFAARRPPEDVIMTLREFHTRMENEVFRHDGTLDKYLGDGLMVTFGTPTPSTSDALNAISCARAMIRSMEQWNEERAANQQPLIQASFGLHFGPVVLGDIGDKRLEFAVIGNTVNVASRLEALTRKHDAVLMASDTFVDSVRRQAVTKNEVLKGFEPLSGETIRGLPEPLPVWRLARQVQQTPSSK